MNKIEKVHYNKYTSIFYNDENEILQGIKQVYSQEGKCFELSNYVDDVKHGYHVEFNPDGSKAMECTYNKGLKDGICNFWDINGIMISSQNFVKGIREGIYQEYNECGELINYSEYKNDLLIINILV